MVKLCQECRRALTNEKPSVFLLLNCLAKAKVRNMWSRSLQFKQKSVKCHQNLFCLTLLMAFNPWPCQRHSSKCPRRVKKKKVAWQPNFFVWDEESQSGNRLCNNIVLLYWKEEGRRFWNIPAKNKRKLIFLPLFSPGDISDMEIGNRSFHLGWGLVSMGFPEILVLVCWWFEIRMNFKMSLNCVLLHRNLTFFY